MNEYIIKGHIGIFIKRTHKCDCGLEIDRDLNAARNVLALGLQCLAKA